MTSICGLMNRRNWISLFLFFGCFNLYTLRVDLSIAIQPMSCQYNWNTKTQGMILSSFFFGYIFGNIAGGVLAAKYGGKLIFGFGIFSSALFSLFIPFSTNGTFINNSNKLNCKCDPSIANNWCFIDNIYTKNEQLCNNENMNICFNNSSNIYPIIALRILMGIFGSVTWPSMFQLINNWAPPNARSIMISIAASGIYIANSMTFSICSFIINHSGWETVFYFFAIIAIIWYILWLYYVYDNPSDDPLISKKELKYLQKTIKLTPNKSKKKSKNINKKKK
eukprot:191501_1